MSRRKTTLSGCLLLTGALLLAGLGGPALAQTTQRGPIDRDALRSGAPEAGAGEVETLDDATLDRIVTLLSGYEYFPSRDDLAAVTADPVPYLLAVAYDTEGRWLPTHHHRAIGALGYFPTPATRAHLSYLLESPQTPELMRHHVINALANGFGDESLEQLEPYLYSDDLQLRLTAVSAIGEIDTSESVTVLQTALSVEPHHLVQERIERTLSTEPQIRPTTP